MPDYRIDIIIDPSRAERGERRVGDSLDRINMRAERTRSLITRAFAFVGVGAAIRQLASLTDTYTNLQNRLRTVTTGQEELTNVTNELFRISNRTRVSFESTAELYARVGLATKDLGISQKETAQFVESLSQAIQIGGATSQEATAGIIQLSQGIASGAVRGDELRSVLEQLPVVTDVIAASLGVTRDQVRQLGYEGKISAGVVLKAFREARVELDQRFSKLVPTISQSFVVLKNNVLQLVGGFNSLHGISGGIAEVIISLANNLDVLGRAAIATGVILAVRFAKQGVLVAVNAVRALTIAIATNPLGALAVAVSAAIVALTAFSDRILVSQDGLATLGDLATEVFNSITSGLGTVVNFFSEVFSKITGYSTDAFSNINLSIKGFLIGTAKAIDTINGVFFGLFDAFEIAYKGVITNIKSSLIDAANVVLSGVTSLLNKAIKIINKGRALLGKALIKPIEAFQLTAVPKAEDLGKRIADAIGRGITENTTAEDAIVGIIDRANTRAGERIKAEQTKAPTLSDVANRPSPYTVTPGSAFVGPPEPINRARTLIEGLRDGLARIKADILDVGSVAENALVNAFNKAEDALVQFVNTGKLNFRDLANSIVSDLTRIAIRQSLANAISSSGGYGSIFGAAASAATNMADGGAFTVGGASGIDRNSLSINGAPVANVSKGERVTVSPSGAGNDRPIQVNFNISTPDANSFQRSQGQILSRTGAAITRATRRHS